MSDKTNAGFHGEGAPPAADNVPEPALAERAKSLVVSGGQSTLSTMSRKHPGYPFGSLMPYGLTPKGEPTFLISSMAMHTRNVLSDPKATLLIVQSGEGENPLGAGRISLMGHVNAVEDGSFREQVTADYLQRNPSAQNWVHYGDFQFFVLNLVDIYFVAGFGMMGWIDAETYHGAEPDPLLPVAAGIGKALPAHERSTGDHRDAMALMAKHFCGIDATDAEMLSVDRLGFNLRVVTPDGVKQRYARSLSRANHRTRRRAESHGRDDKSGTRYLAANGSWIQNAETSFALEIPAIAAQRCWPSRHASPFTNTTRRRRT